jgi:hypothetical protein
MKKVILLAVVIFLTSNLCQGKDFDISLNSGVSFDQSVWKPQLDEGAKSHDVPPWVGIEINYNRWKFQPTLGFSFTHEKFDSSTPNSPVLRTSPDVYSFSLGLTRELKYFNVSVLGVLSHFECNSTPNRLNPQSNVGGVKVGVSKLWKTTILGTPIKMGPLVDVTWYPKEAQFDIPPKQAEKLNRIVPQVGLKIKW